MKSLTRIYRVSTSGMIYWICINGVPTVSRQIRRSSEVEMSRWRRELLPWARKAEKSFPLKRKTERKERERWSNERAGDRVVGPTKLLGSTTDTFLASNHQDTMTTRSLAPSPTRRPPTIGLIAALFLIVATRKSFSYEYCFNLIHCQPGRDCFTSLRDDPTVISRRNCTNFVSFDRRKWIRNY